MLNNAPDELSEREREILRLVATGASNKEIAKQLVISPNTVKVHLRNIFAKIGAASRTEAAMYAVRVHLVSEPSYPIPEQTPFTPSTDQILISRTEPDTALTAPPELAETDAAAEPVAKKQLTGWLWIAALIIVALAAIILIPQLIQPEEEAITSSLVPDSSERWRQASPMSVGRLFPAAVAYEGSIYVIGGENESGTSGSVELYNPNTDQWLPMKDKPLPVSEIQAAILEDKIFIPGGKSSDQSVSNQVELYDPQTDVWGKGTDLPVPLSAYSLVNFEGKILLFGGWDGKNFRTEVYEYDPEEMDWHLLTNMEAPRGFAGAVVIGNHIYIAGGSDGQKAYSDILVFRPNQGESGAWDKPIEMLAGRYAGSVAALADSIYFFGGKANQGETLSPWQYNPQSKGWYRFETPEITGWSSMTAVPLQNLIYLFGGQIDSKPSASVWTFQALYTLAIPVLR